MRVLFHIPFYIDWNVSGGEMTAKDLIQALQDEGHEVRILVANKKDWTNPILFADHEQGITPHFEWCDICITHLGQHGTAYNNCRHLSKPLIVYLHNSYRYAIIQSRPQINVIYNSEFVYKELSQTYERNNGTIIRPILYPRFKEAKGDKVLIINMNKNKGGLQYLEVIKAMPEQEFICIKGGYGEQIIPDLPNVEVIENCLDIEQYVRQCKCLLMLSKYESYGRTAVECILSGLFVVYNKTGEGLKEAVGSGGIMVDRHNTDEVVKAIRSNVNVEKRKQELLTQIAKDKENFCIFVKNCVHGASC